MFPNTTMSAIGVFALTGARGFEETVWHVYLNDQRGLRIRRRSRVDRNASAQNQGTKRRRPRGVPGVLVCVWADDFPVEACTGVGENLYDALVNSGLIEDSS